MIDITTEELIPLRGVPKRLPPRPDGGRIHISAVYRWVSRGIHGVVLESVRIGGSTYTSAEALARWAVRLTNPDATSETPTPKQRQCSLEKLSRRVACELGIGRRTDRHFCSR